MDLEIIILSEVSQAEENVIWYHWYVKSKKKKKKDTSDLICKPEIDSQT